MEDGTMLTLAAFGAGLLATLLLAAWLTPRSWWRRANLRALTVLAGGTAAIGALLLSLAPPFAAAKPGTVGTPCPRGCAPDSSVLVATSAPPAPGATYRVYRDLNVRAASGVQAKRLAVVPAGASVTATGRQHGDWWQVSAMLEGRELRGWASSLWLRRGEEFSPARPPAPSD